MREPFSAWQDPHVQRGALIMGGLFFGGFSLLLNVYWVWGLIHHIRYLRGDNLAESVLFIHPYMNYLIALF